MRLFFVSTLAAACGLTQGSARPEADSVPIPPLHASVSVPMELLSWQKDALQVPPLSGSERLAVFTTLEFAAYRHCLAHVRVN